MSCNLWSADSITCVAQIRFKQMTNKMSAHCDANAWNLSTVKVHSVK